MSILDWSTNPLNNAIKPGLTWAEGMFPSDVNGSARVMMADIATWLKSPSFPDASEILINGTPVGRPPYTGDKQTLNTGVSIPTGTALVQADSFAGTARSSGPIPYVKGRGTTDAVRAKFPRFTFRSADLEAWEMPLRGPTAAEAGMRPDGTAQDAAMRETLDWAYERGIPEVYFPNTRTDPGYTFADTILLDTQMTLRGASSGKNPQPGSGGYANSKFVFPAGKDGVFIAESQNGVRPGKSGGDASRLIGLMLVGGDRAWSSAAASCAAVRMRARAEISQCVINYFGDGVNIETASGGSNGTAGNANGWSVRDCRFDSGFRHGINTSLADSNGGNVHNVDIGGYNGFAIFANSFLGNSYSGFIQVTTCGTFGYRRGGPFAGIIHTINNLYHFFTPDPYATSAELASTPPSLSTNYPWVLVYADLNPTFPLWQQGSMDYAPGGAFMIAGPAKTDGFFYSEGDCPASQVMLGAAIRDGLHAAPIVGTGSVTSTYQSFLTSRNGFVASKAPGSPAAPAASFGAGIASGRWQDYSAPTSFPSSIVWQMSDAASMGLFVNGQGPFIQLIGANGAPGSLNRMRLRYPLFEYNEAADNDGALSLGLAAGRDYYLNTTTHAITRVF